MVSSNTSDERGVYDGASFLFEQVLTAPVQHETDPFAGLRNQPSLRSPVPDYRRCQTGARLASIWVQLGFVVCVRPKWCSGD